jgi:hypothetical protein
MNENERVDETLLSQLADGELPSDQVNEVLLAALDDEQAREKLKAQLSLRQGLRGWRNQQPERTVIAIGSASERPRSLRRRWRLGSLAVAAGIGGVLVLAGFWAAGVGGRTREIVSMSAPSREIAVTAEQMRQVASVFALHESVAGPLAWYASDDQNVRVSSAESDETGHRPVAVLLKFAPAGPGGTARSYVIVCRENQAAAIDLPSDATGTPSLRVYLTPQAVNGKVDMQYAISVDGRDQRGQPGERNNPGTLSGQRHIGLSQTSLGQLALNDRLLSVEASAWPIKEAQN